jgi:hypothetical protein
MEPQKTIRVALIGRERQPVIVVDNFVPEPEALVEQAAALDFSQMGAYYPGVRATVPAHHVAAYVAPLAELIAATFGIAPNPGVIEAMFSLVTTPPSALRPIQRMPHFDGCEPERLALLHYLGGCEDSGTTFYRHRGTGFETIDHERVGLYDAALHSDVAMHGMPQPAYISGSTPIFEQTAHFEAQFNRALIYRGNLLHCANIAPETPMSDDPRTGRLTVNTFLMGEV